MGGVFCVYTIWNDESAQPKAPCRGNNVYIYQHAVGSKVHSVETNPTQMKCDY